MSVDIRAKRTIGSTPPPDIEFGQIAYSDANQALYIGRQTAGEVTTYLPAIQAANQAIWNASRLQGKAISDQAPADGEGLVWSEANQRYEPAPAGDGGEATTEWGDINGNLGDQTDLAAALNTKADGAAVAAAIADFETTTQLNDRDTANRNRDNHTGAQLISTVTGLQTALDGKAATTAIANFENTTQLDGRDTANRNRDNHTGAQAISTVTGLQTALNSKAGKYIRLGRIREFENVAIPTTKQSYTIANTPTGKNVLLHCFINPGLAAIGGHLQIAFFAPSDTTPTLISTSPWSGNAVYDLYSSYVSSNWLCTNAGHFWLPCENQVISAIRLGNYSNSGAQTTLDVLGYQEY